MMLVGRRRVRRLAAGMAAVLALTVVIVADVNGFTPASRRGSAPDPGGINASADAYVSGASPGSNYGSSTTLVANATGPVYTHLQFQVSGSNGATSGTLQVYSTSSGTTLTKVYAEPADVDRDGSDVQLAANEGCPAGHPFDARHQQLLDVDGSADGRRYVRVRVDHDGHLTAEHDQPGDGHAATAGPVQRTTHHLPAQFE